MFGVLEQIHILAEFQLDLDRLRYLNAIIANSKAFHSGITQDMIIINKNAYNEREIYINK